MGRFIGIRHRVKRTAENEARPTRLAIVENGAVRTLDLEEETDELDFVLGRLPVRFRPPAADEDLSVFTPRHIMWRKLKEYEKPDSFPANLIRHPTDDLGRGIEDGWETASKIPA